VAYTSQTGMTKIQLLMEYENVSQKVYLATLHSPHSCLVENMTSYFKMAAVQEKALCVLWFSETKSVIKTQHRYRTQYGKDSPSDNAVRR
jgi:hypothetical protein